jgi:hypothetical protein
VRTLRLALRLARWDRPASIGVAASAALLSLLFAAALIVNATYLQTIADGVASDNGGFAYRLEVVDSRADITTQLSEQPEWVAVWTASVQVRAGSRLVPARASSVRPSAALDGFGDLVAGHAPHRPDEVSVSRMLAGGLALRAGDTVTVTAAGSSPAEVTVTGVYVNATRPREVSMYRRVATPPGDPPDAWLSDVSPAGDSHLSAAYDRGQVKFRSTRGLVSDQQEQAASSVLAPLRYLPHLFAVVAVILLAAIMAALRIRVRRVIHGLTAAGMSTGRARRVPILTATAVVLTGIAGGYLVAIAAITAARPLLGTMVDQHWQNIAIPWGWLAALMVGLPALLHVLFTLAATGRRRTEHLSLAGGSRAKLGAAVLVAVLGFVLQWRAGGRSAGGVSAALYGGLLLAIALPGLLLAVPSRRSSVTASAVRTFGLSIGGTAVVVSAMLFLTSFFGVRLADTAAADNPAVQPIGSLVIDGLSDADATAVESAYRRFSRAQVWRLPLPQETTVSLRVATPAFVTCVDALPRPSLDLAGDCPTGVSLTPVNRTAITGSDASVSAPSPPHTVFADPQLIEDGKVGLLIIGMTGDAQAIERAVVVDARPLPGLGGNLPGAIVDPADPVVAQDAGLPHASMLVLHDFAELSQSDKAEVRGAIATTAGYAQVSEDQRASDGGGRVLALMIMATGALVVLLLLLAATAALNTAQADFRKLLSQLGIPAPRRLAVGLRVLSVPCAAALFSAAIAALASWRAGSDPLAETALLLVPASCALVAVLLCAALYARDPENRFAD